MSGYIRGASTSVAPWGGAPRCHPRTKPRASPGQFEHRARHGRRPFGPIRRHSSPCGLQAVRGRNAGGGYSSRLNRYVLALRGLSDGILHEAARNQERTQAERAAIHLGSSVRSTVKRAWGALKRGNGFSRARYLGLAKAALEILRNDMAAIHYRAAMGWAESRSVNRAKRCRLTGNQERYSRAMLHTNAHSACSRVQFNSFDKPRIGRVGNPRKEVRIFYGRLPKRIVAHHLPSGDLEGSIFLNSIIGKSPSLAFQHVKTRKLSSVIEFV